MHPESHTLRRCIFFYLHKFKVKIRVNKEKRTCHVRFQAKYCAFSVDKPHRSVNAAGYYYKASSWHTNGSA